MNKKTLMLLLFIIFLAGCSSKIDHAKEEVSDEYTGKAVSFTLTNYEAEIFVTTNLDGTIYEAKYIYENNFGPEPKLEIWYAISIPPKYCFTKENYKYYYCINQDAPVLLFAKNYAENGTFLDNIPTGSYSTVRISEDPDEKPDLSTIPDEVLMQWVPGHELFVITSNVEIILGELEKNNLREGPLTIIQQNEQITLGNISEIIYSEHSIYLPHEYIDLENMSEYVAEKKLFLSDDGYLEGFGTGALDYSDASFSEGVQMMYGLNINDFIIKQ